jgi:hypothetical protein
MPETMPNPGDCIPIYCNISRITRSSGACPLTGNFWNNTLISTSPWTLSQDTQRLKQLRTCMRSRMKDSMLMDVKGFTSCLESARLHYACSAHYMDHIDGINLTAEQQAFLKEIQDPLFRESVRDFMVNQQFRRD